MQHLLGDDELEGGRPAGVDHHAHLLLPRRLEVAELRDHGHLGSHQPPADLAALSRITWDKSSHQYAARRSFEIKAKYCSMTCLKLEEEVLISFLTPSLIAIVKPQSQVQFPYTLLSSPSPIKSLNNEKKEGLGT